MRGTLVYRGILGRLGPFVWRRKRSANGFPEDWLVRRRETAHHLHAIVLASSPAPLLLTSVPIPIHLSGTDNSNKQVRLIETSPYDLRRAGNQRETCYPSWRELAPALFPTGVFGRAIEAPEHSRYCLFRPIRQVARLADIYRRWTVRAGANTTRDILVLLMMPEQWVGLFGAGAPMVGHLTDLLLLQFLQ
jgi:hypothetical protein